MAKLNRLFSVGQAVKCNFDGDLFNGTIKEAYNDYIIVDVPKISDHCYFENGFNIGDVYPIYNFN